MYEVVVRHLDTARVIARAHYGGRRIAAREASSGYTGHTYPRTEAEQA